MKRIFALILGLLLCCSSALAHPGGTDSKGGHTNHSTGEYHYHHGYSAHQHENGQCPYDFDDKTGQSSGSASSVFSDFNRRANATPKPTAKPVNGSDKELSDMSLPALAISAASGFLFCLIIMLLVQRSLRKEHRERIASLQRQHSDNVQQLNSGYENRLATRRNEQLRLMEELREITGNLDFEDDSPLQKLLKHTAEPDLSEGVVYVKYDLSSNRYHFLGHCDTGLVLASLASLKRLGFVPCECCESAEQPTHDPLVMVSSSSSHVYHRDGTTCSGAYFGMRVPISEALKKGRRACLRCKPIPDQPKVWY